MDKADNKRVEDMLRCNMLLKRKSIIFSLDALLALVSGIILIIASFFYISQIQTIQWGQPAIYIMTMDSLNTLKTDRTLENAVETNSSTTLSKFLNNMLGPNTCGGIELYNSTGSRRLSVNKTGCSSPVQVYIARRTLISNNIIYYATMRSWYK